MTANMDVPCAHGNYGLCCVCSPENFSVRHREANAALDAILACCGRINHCPQLRVGIMPGNGRAFEQAIVDALLLRAQRR